MKLSVLLFFASALLVPARSTATANCPWLTKGSAETALGGTVTATAQVSESGQGFCTFSREDNPKDTLKIIVQKTALPECPAGSLKLKGIGNEAVMCTVQRSPQESVDMIVSRVRDLHFTVTMTAHKKPANGREVSSADSPIEQIAEQVAGNLF